MIFKCKWCDTCSNFRSTIDTHMRICLRKPRNSNTTSDTLTGVDAGLVAEVVIDSLFSSSNSSSDNSSSFSGDGGSFGGGGSSDSW